MDTGIHYQPSGMGSITLEGARGQSENHWVRWQLEVRTLSIWGILSQEGQYPGTHDAALSHDTGYLPIQAAGGT